MKYTPGQLLRCRHGRSEHVSELVIVVSSDMDVRYLCAAGKHAGQLQTVCPQTASRFYERLLHVDGGTQ